MSRITKSVQRFANGIPQKLRTARIAYGEKKAIRRKQGLIDSVSWTPEQNRAFETYWKESYGKTISPAWHKLYQSMNGHFDVRYFPEFFYSTKLEPLLNPADYSQVFSDKSLLPYLFGPDQPDLHIPKVYLNCVRGAFCSDKNDPISKETALRQLNDLGPCVIKPSVDSGSGHGVYIADLANGVDQNTGKPVADIIDEMGPNFVVQERIRNNAKISAICPESLNTLRLITYYVGTDLFCAPAVLRMGSGEKAVDNIHAGGLCIGVSKDGILKDRAYKLGAGDTNLTFTHHPKTNIAFAEYCIGDVSRAIDAVMRLHKRIPQLGIVSWDVALGENDQVVLIEANCRDQSIWFPQIVNEEPFFGDNTEYFLRLISKHR